MTSNAMWNPGSDSVQGKHAGEKTGETQLRSAICVIVLYPCQCPGFDLGTTVT